MNKLIIFFTLFSVSLHAQMDDNNVSQETKVYYWFYIKVYKSVDKKTGTNKIFLNNVGNEIESGSFHNFIENHKNGLKNGKIAVGPFSEEHHAQNSQWLYKNAGRESGNSKSDLNHNGDEPVWSFFYVKPIAGDSMQEINFQRIPSRVTSGYQNDFTAMLNEGLSFDELAIGPFNSYELAEKSKFVYRKNDQAGSYNQADSASTKSLKTMAKRWKSLKLEIVKKSDDLELKKSTYRFNTSFPSKYFASDAYQIITIITDYSDSNHAANTSFTLQGDGVLDNNYSISSSLSTVYINIFQVDDHSPVKIKGFLLESFIYNDSNIIELEPIYISK